MSINNTDEILDIVNEDGVITGTAPRSLCHTDPTLIHQVVHCWIFNKTGQVLWQQRSYSKDSSPGKWDMSVGGHVPNGEKPNQSIKRELLEELSIKNIKLTLIDKYIQRFPTQTEFIYLYFAIVNKPANKFKLQKTEVQQVVWIDPAEAQLKFAKAEISSTEFIISQVTKILQKLAFKK